MDQEPQLPLSEPRDCRSAEASRAARRCRGAELSRLRPARRAAARPALLRRPLAWYFSSRAGAATAAESSPATPRRASSGNSGKTRGWVREARHYLKLGRNIQCKLCPNECLLEPEDRGHCRNRVHKDGKLYTLAYANPSMPQLDPIEKKPLLHFLPGSVRLLARHGRLRLPLPELPELGHLAAQAGGDEGPPRRGRSARRPPTCNSPRRDDVNRMSIFPEDVVAMAEYFDCRSIAYTYSEPIVWFEYMIDTAKAARAKNAQELLDHLRLHPGGAAGGAVPGTRRGQRQPQEFQRRDLPRLNTGKLEPSWPRSRR